MARPGYEGPVEVSLVSIHREGGFSTAFAVEKPPSLFVRYEWGMTTWRDAPPLSNPQRTLIRDGLLVEYAPGLVAPIDLAATPALRGALLAPLLPAPFTAVTLSAVWIYTGWWPQDRLSGVFAAHPSKAKHPASFRRTIPSDFTMVIGGVRVTTPARTAADLLLLESPDIAIEGIFMMLGVHLQLDEITDQLRHERGRRHLPRARHMIPQLAEYVEWRTRELIIAAVTTAAHAGSPPFSSR